VSFRLVADNVLRFKRLAASYPSCNPAVERMTVLGQSRRIAPQPATTGLPQSTDIKRPAQLVRFVPTCDIGAALKWLEAAN
jgi:hypothetical protein